MCHSHIYIYISHSFQFITFPSFGSENKGRYTATIISHSNHDASIFRQLFPSRNMCCFVDIVASLEEGPTFYWFEARTT